MLLGRDKDIVSRRHLTISNRGLPWSVLLSPFCVGSIEPSWILRLFVTWTMLQFLHMLPERIDFEKDFLSVIDQIWL